MDNCSDIESKIYRLRSTLTNTKRAIESGKITIGMIGGSITDDRGRNWPDPFCALLQKQYPGLKITVENAAIGGTGSDHGLFRAERDILSRNCDLVFVDYSVNDASRKTEFRNPSREGLLRKLLISGKSDVVLLHMFCKSMYKTMVLGETPPTIKEFEVLAEHYQINSVWCGLYAFNEVNSGIMKWHEWLPDGLHPQYRGSYSYAQAIITGITRMLGYDLPDRGNKMPAPMCSDDWSSAYCIKPEELKYTGPWVLKRSSDNVWMEYILHSSGVGHSVEFEFEGIGFSIGTKHGLNSGDLLCSVDDGEWKALKLSREAWMGDCGFFSLYNVASKLDYAKHTVRLKTTYNSENGQSAECNIAFIGVIR